MAKTASYYGLQDAAQKRRAHSQSPWAWAGAVVKTTSSGVFKLVSDERWTKVKGHIGSLQNWASHVHIDRKALERIRGFLVYVTLTNASMTAYLKRIHLTLDSWRPDWDDKGWKMTPYEWTTAHARDLDHYGS
ncbi:hypothetical protein ACA910_007270 [Epithemia clementina (nom. ined.)]